MPEVDKGLFDEFMEFVSAKQAAEADSADDNDEVEVWDKDGRGARVKKKDAKPFLQTLGILLDPKEEDDSDGDKNDKSKSRPTGKTVKNAAATGAATSTVKKYFSK